MKGTFFSSDFVIDKDENLRLIEINTDTGAVASQTGSFDWTDFINILDTNNITKVDVTYKVEIQQPIVDSLAAALAESASFVTEFNPITIPGNSIFPTSPEDATDKFILRMAYDETAILDSEYAKGTLNTLKLFVDNNDADSVTNFYHSSSMYGDYNTLDTTIFNGDVLPDAVSKTVTELHQPHKFWKIGHSTDTNENRYNDFINQVADSNILIQQYHLDQSQKDAGIVNSVRTFQIVYGSDLDICYVSEYEIDATLELPTSIQFDDTIAANLIESKHYYEYASNHIKNQSHGVLDDEGILDVNGNVVHVADMVVGNQYQGYHIEGLPETDNFDILDAYSISGSSLPSGSHITTTTLVSVGTDTTYANDMTLITFADSADVVVGGQTRFLVYCPEDDAIRFKRVLDLDTTHSIFKMDGTLNGITAIDVVIYNQPQEVWEVNMDPVNNFMLESGNFMSFFITHNLGSCFIAGTKITMEDGSTKNIEDIVEGDIVLSFNEESKIIEPKKVIGLKQPIHNDIVKYHISNGDDIICTFDHPLYVNGLELASYMPDLTNVRYEIGREVVKIKEGDLLSQKDGDSVSIRMIEPLPEIDIQTYIITIENNHNFYVNGILVHNK